MVVWNNMGGEKYMHILQLEINVNQEHVNQLMTKWTFAITQPTSLSPLQSPPFWPQVHHPIQFLGLSQSALWTFHIKELFSSFTLTFKEKGLNKKKCTLKSFHKFEWYGLLTDSWDSLGTRILIPVSNSVCCKRCLWKVVGQN